MLSCFSIKHFTTEGTDFTEEHRCGPGLGLLFSRCAEAGGFRSFAFCIILAG